MDCTATLSLGMSTIDPRADGRRARQFRFMEDWKELRIRKKIGGERCGLRPGRSEKSVLHGNVKRFVRFSTLKFVVRRYLEQGCILVTARDVGERAGHNTHKRIAMLYQQRNL